MENYTFILVKEKVIKFIVTKLLVIREKPVEICTWQKRKEQYLENSPGERIILFIYLLFWGRGAGFTLNPNIIGSLASLNCFRLLAGTANCFQILISNPDMFKHSNFVL